MGSFCYSFLSTFMVFIAYFSLPAFSSHIKLSTISAAPAVLPYAPLPSFAPALSPDISPLFPTPVSGISPSPADSSIPTIPSSPSPPNPDDLQLAPGPAGFAFSPSESLPAARAVSSAPKGCLMTPNPALFFVGMVFFWLMQSACI